MELEKIKGIGPKILNELFKLGINNIEDLKTHYPYRYEVIKKTELLDGQKVITDGIIVNSAIISYLKSVKDKMSFQIETNNTIVNVVLFNRGYLKNKLVAGSKVTVIGKYSKKNNTILVSEIRFGLIGNMIKYEPIYHATAALNSSKINTLINSVKYEVKEVLPQYINDKYQFRNKDTALSYIHNPSSLSQINLALEKLKYEELFIFMLKMNFLKLNKKRNSFKRDVSYKLISDKISKLPFKLTEDQITSIEDIFKDLTSGKRMNRLLQGDVGSGKTIVSFLALYINFLSGMQGALMAPTEILAEQHYLNFKKLFPDISVVLLTGKNKGKKIIESIKSGCSVVIGTHALISENVTYNNLGLVITDEQHRFGVNQRNSLQNKGILPDVLYMSATPIPRTYAITLFGDMDISSIKTKPAGRKEIITYVKKNDEIKDVLKIIYEEIKKNHQVYVVAPLIEESENSSLENVIKLQDKMNLAFGKVCKTGIMHGKLSSKEKESVMTQFKNNEIQILISTTVIEVGVDVMNATCMVVFDSYRFGLSALHQLRGRIGRNSLQSYFILLSDVEASRLNVLVKTNDGFKVSEYDFKLRGSGELFGIKQSGDMEFKLSDLKKDYDILLKAKSDSEEVLPKINDYPQLLEVLKPLNNLS